MFGHAARIAIIGIVSVNLILSCAGCGLRIATSGERKASFLPYARTRIAAQPTQEFLLKRTALLISADGLSLILPTGATRGDPSRFGIRAFAPRYGAASAIDSRGYFLTASHNFGDKAPYLVFYQDDRLQVVPSRIVWRGDLSKNRPDLAILRVSNRLDFVFEWAPSIAPGVTAFAAGFNSGDGAQFRLVYLAGRVLRIFERPVSGEAGTTIFHQAPLHRGDSGGPLIAPDGRLLGINNKIQLSIFQRGPVSIAQRPDVNRLHQIIATDAQKAHGDEPTAAH